MKKRKTNYKQVRNIQSHFRGNNCTFDYFSKYYDMFNFWR